MSSLEVGAFSCLWILVCDRYTKMINAKSTVIANAIRVDNSIVACSLLARFLRDYLRCEVVDSADAPLRRAKYDTLIMINSPWGFCSEDHRVRVREILWSARRVVWAQQDYNSGIGPRSFKSMGAWLDGGRALDLWTTIPEYVERGYITKKIPLTPRSAYVNWNALHYAPLDKRTVDSIRANDRAPESVFYFGSYRPERESRFKRYLTPHSYKVRISTAVGRSVERFREALGPDIIIEKRESDLITRLASEHAVVYMEDERGVDRYFSPSARFYEALSARCCQFIDADAVANLERGGFAVDPDWVVRDGIDVHRKLKRAPDIAVAQHKRWASPKIRAAFQAQLVEALQK